MKTRNKVMREGEAHCADALVWLAARGWDLAPLTGQDRPALEAVAHCWRLWGTSDEDGRRAALGAIAALVGGMQEVAWPMARELAAHALDWGHRGELWPLVCEEYEHKWSRALFSSEIDPHDWESRSRAVERLRLCHVNLPQVRQPDLSIARGVP